jgi:fluoroquinolone transport system permease protein
VHALAAFALADARSVRRDPLLLELLLAPPVLVAVLTLGRDLVDIGVFAPLVASFVLVVFVPYTVGVVFGLLLLDDRDSRVLEALRVTPLSVGGYLAYRAGLAVAISVLNLLVWVPASGLLPAGAIARAVPSLLCAGLFAPIPALLFATFARNKVEGLAVLKAASLLVFLPLVAWFVESDWQLLFGVLPTYWTAKAFWEAAAGGPWAPFVLAGLAYHALLLRWLLRRAGR